MIFKSFVQHLLLKRKRGFLQYVIDQFLDSEGDAAMKNYLVSMQKACIMIFTHTVKC